MKDVTKASRIVVKVGTSTLTHANGLLNFRRIDELARVLSDLKNEGKKVVLVSSGAIGVGAAKLGMNGKPHELKEKQAGAAVGQCELMHIYDKMVQEDGQTVNMCECMSLGYALDCIKLADEEFQFELDGSESSLLQFDEILHAAHLAYQTGELKEADLAEFSKLFAGRCV